jgi:hypothetical protein
MAIRHDGDGILFTDIDCPMCENFGPHLRVDDIGDSMFFRCAVCQTMFGDGEPTFSTWLPDHS